MKSKYFIKNSNFLITGGTGSFGNTMINYLISKGAKSIKIFSRDEKKQDDMRKKYNNSKLKFLIGDIRDISAVNLATKNVDYIFHAAALKQVPSCEFFPMEAVNTNVIGTDNLCKSAINSGVKKVVCLSTDKAVYPINAMGTSKAMMEKVILAYSRHNNKSSDTQFCITRYGNVLASRGSVLPYFINQINNNEKVTITNPFMTRFLMSLEESVMLVMYAFTSSLSGEICVQKSPAANINDFAKAVLDLKKNKSKPIIIGSRHGEKMHEVLLSQEEASKAIEHENFFRVPMDERDLNYDKYFSIGVTKKEKPPYTSQSTIQLTVQEIKNRLIKIPESKIFFND